MKRMCVFVLLYYTLDEYECVSYEHNNATKTTTKHKGRHIYFSDYVMLPNFNIIAKK